MKKYAAIDIGTNSTRLLIATVNQGRIISREKHLITTRMGQGVDENKIINVETILRNLGALKEFKALSESKGVEDFIVFGTSALRDAKNAEEFIDLAKKDLDLNVNILDGQEEAQYAFLGVSEQFKGEPFIIMDVGGGSTELVCASNGRIINSISFNMGAVRMTERFIKNDPPLNEEIRSITEFVHETLRGTYNMEEPFTIIGVGGTATTLSQIDQEMEEYTPQKIHNSEIFAKNIDHMIKKFISLKDEDRKKIIGLSPKRSDVITAGAIIVSEVLKRYKKDSFKVSDYDNLEGAIFNFLKKFKKVIDE